MWSIDETSPIRKLRERAQHLHIEYIIRNKQMVAEIISDRIQIAIERLTY
ncbi:Uncharacterised protein [Yersinia intermedia]|nr:Uncharacterised protein [Yersinia intermedia]CQJ67409.1 Uncharacterised protein [Yersinia intermedia]